MNISNADNSYDKVIYDALPHVQGNIRHLETIADLFCVNPVDVNRCRILELGAGTGKTIISQAENLPDSSFVGLDLGATQVESGQQLIRTLDLKNVELKHADIMEVDDSWGKFDYIIAHGVYSWVPQFVRDKIIDICSNNLGLNGVAMISYNTYPGWHFKEYARNLMFLHAVQGNDFPDAATQIQQARSIVNYIAKRNKDLPNSYFTRFFDAFSRHLQVSDDHYVFHEYLEANNAPCYFLDFCRKISEKNLRFVSEFVWNEYQAWRMDEELNGLIEKLRHYEIAQQYMDYMVNRTFRASIICRGECSHEIRPDIITRYHFYVPYDCNFTLLDQHTPKKWLIKRDKGMDIRLYSNPFIDTFVDFLKRNRSRYFRYQEVWESLVAANGPHILDGQLDRKDFEQTFEQILRYGLLQPILHPPRSDRDNQRPYVRGFVRQLAQHNSASLPNDLFEVHQVDSLTTAIIRRLDGRHALADIVNELQKDLRNGRLTLSYQGYQIGADQREQLSTIIGTTIERLRQYRFIV